MSIPYMPLYVADYLGDTQHLSTEQHGAYMLLLMALWRAGGRLPSDPAKLVRIVRLSPSKWAKIGDDVMAFFDADDDGITQKRLAVEIEKASKKSQVRSAAGKAGATAKALKTNKPHQANASPLLKHSSEPEPEEDTSSLRSDVGAAEPTPAKATRSESKRRCQVDASGYQPEIAVALEIGLSQAEAEIEVPRFLDHHRAKGSLMLKWDAAWRTWCRNAVQWRRPAPPGQQRAPPPAKGTNAMLDSLAKFATRNDHDDRPSPEHLDLPAISRGH